MRITKPTVLALIACLGVAFILHSWGMFHYPYYEGDEGIYVSQAWSFLKEGALSPYAYWYDHPPFGWIVMSGWGALLGGNFFVFGESSIDNMRVFMLIVHLLSAGLVFFIARRLTKNTHIAVFATLFFTISPLFIYYQRRVLLDNMMTLWLLLSFAILLVRSLRVRHILFSGVFFAFALLTKIPAIVFLPAFLYVLTQRDVALHILRRFALWLFAAFCIGMIFIGYTLVKGEFFPPSDTGPQHVSFISGIQFQLDRDSEYVFWHPDSSFRFALDDWLSKDIPTIIIAAIGIVIGLVGMVKNVALRSVMIFVIVYLLFLIRGGIVTNFYILPLVPFVAIACGMSFWWLAERITPSVEKVTKGYLIFTIVLFFVLFAQSSKDYLIKDETTNYTQAIKWIKENIDGDKAIMTDVQALVDLRDPRNEGTSFEKADWFSKVLHDDFIQEYTYLNDYKNIHYVLSSHELLRQLGNFSDDKMAKQAYLNSAPIKDWTKDAGHINEELYQSSIGNWAKLYEVGDDQSGMLERAWRTYKKNYTYSYGMISDREEGVGSSRSQSYSMLQALWAHDRATFDQLWQWATDQLQHRSDDQLLSSMRENGVITIAQNDSFADSNIAAAFTLASKKWGDDEHREQAVTIISDLWRQSVVEIGGRYYMLPAEKWSQAYKESYVYDPSVITPAWYRLFSELDSEHPWEQLAEDSYKTFTEIRSGGLLDSELVDQWFYLDRDSGQLRGAGSDDDARALIFGFDPMRLMWNTSLDALWHDREDATEFTITMSDILLQKGSDDTGVTSDASDAVMLALAVANSDRERVELLYAKNFSDVYDSNTAYWTTAKNPTDAQWLWMGAALYRGQILNQFNK